MSRRAIARAVSATVIGLGVAIPAIALAAPAASAAPSFAALHLAAPQLAAPQLAASQLAVPLLAAVDCCQASIGGLPGKFVAGAGPSQFTVSFTNSSQQQVSSLSLVFVFRGNALNSGQITMKRRTQNGSWQGINVGERNGAVTATDSRIRFGQPIQPNGSTSLQYQLSFGSKAASTQVQLGVTISGRAGGHGVGQSTELATTGAQFSVVAAAPPPAPKPSPTLTPTPTAAASDPSTPQSAAGIDTGPGGPPITPADAASKSGTSSLVWLAYVIGALLLVGGIGAIGTLLWRRGPDTIENEWDDDGTALHPGGGAAAFPPPNTYPTQPLPAPAYPTQSYPSRPYPPEPFPSRSPLPPPPQDPYGRHSADSSGQLPG
jgi:hypothetical protein